MVKSSEVTVPMEPALEQAIEQELGYGDSKAEYIRDAIRERLEREGSLPDGLETDGGSNQAKLAD